MKQRVSTLLIALTLLVGTADNEASAQSAPDVVTGESADASTEGAVRVFGCDHTSLSALLDAEPDIQEVISAAGLDSAPVQYESERRRLRRAHALPTRARVTGGLRVDRESESRRRVVQGFEGLDADDASIEDRSTDDRDLFIDLGLSLEWRLDQLVRDDREVEVMRQSNREHDAAVALRRELIALFYERRQLLAALCSEANGTPLASIRSTPLYLRIEEVEAELVTIADLPAESALGRVWELIEELTVSFAINDRRVRPRVDSDRSGQ